MPSCLSLRLRAAAPLVAALFVLQAAGCRGAEPATPPVKAGELAEKAAAAEMAARSVEAAELYLKAAIELAETTRKAEKAEKTEKAEKKEKAETADKPGLDQAAAWAEVEFLVEKAYALASLRLFRGRLVEPLGKLGKLAEGRPDLGAQISWRLANCLRAAGDEKAAAKEFRRLGFVTDWQVIGPFDNERGQGFAQAYPPETELDLAKNYPGKKRKVAWQRNPCQPEDGYVDLAGMLRPNQEAVAYLLAYVQVDGKKDLPAAVRLASDDGVRVWLNGREVLKREAQRPAVFDQDRFGVVLRPGHNALLVKVAQADGEWGLRLRLTAPDGAALKDVEVRADRVYPAVEPAAGAAPEIELGALGHFEKRAAAEPKDAAALLRLGFLTSRAAAFDREKGERPDRKLLEAAVKAEPTSARLWYELSAVAAASGRMRVESDENPRRRALEQSVKIAPSAAAELELAAHYLRQYRNFGKAAAHLEKARTLSPDSLEVRLLEAEMSIERGDAAEAFAAAAALAKANPASCRAQLAQASALEAAGNLQAGAEAAAAAFKLDCSEDREVERLARVWLGTGQLYKALEVYDGLLARRPYRTDIRAERARLLAGGGKYDQAIEECQKGLNVCREDHKLLGLLGEYLAATKKPDRAREAWRQALELQPNYVELERYVEYVENRVSYDRKHRENVTDLLATAPRVSGAANQPGAYLLNKVIDRVYPDGTNSRTIHVLIKILNDSGAKRFGEDRIVYYADEQRAVVRTARAVRADGREEQAKVLPEQVVPVGERRLAVRSIRFPPLAAGDAIEVEYRIDDLEQGFFGRYFGNVYHFRQDLPVTLAKYVLIAPAGLELHSRPVRCELQPEVRQDPDDKATVYTWAMRDQPAIDSEPLMPPMSELSPAVEVSTYKDWTSFGKWYWGLIRKQHEAGPEVARLSKELCANAATEMDKIRAVYNYVVTDIRYVAWEFGVHGFKPYRAEQIVARKFGDCKDKATLICALLAEQGIAAHPVLIRADVLRGQQDLGLPLISNFNHCIAWLPAGKDRPELWLDGTAQYCSLDALLDTDRGARVAVVAPEGATVRDIPPSAPEMNATTCDFRLSLSLDGLARGTVRSTAGGDRSMVCRSTFQKPEYRPKILSRLYGRRHQGANVVGVTGSDLKDLNAPVSFRYAVDLPGCLRRSGDEFVLELPDDPLRGVLGYGGKDELFPEHFTVYASGTKREHDVVLPAAWQHAAHYEVKLPEGLAPAALPADAKVEGEFGKLAIARKVEGGKLIVDKSLALAVTRVPVAKYAEFRKFCLEVDRLESEKITLARKAAGPEKDKDKGKEKDKDKDKDKDKPASEKEGG
jgi:transglutaminase-like putative cysteine protease/Flp pilus assembly protein TadD